MATAVQQRSFDDPWARDAQAIRSAIKMSGILTGPLADMYMARPKELQRVLDAQPASLGERDKSELRRRKRGKSST